MFFILKDNIKYRTIKNTHSYHNIQVNNKLYIYFIFILKTTETEHKHIIPTFHFVLLWSHYYFKYIIKASGK